MEFGFSHAQIDEIVRDHPDSNPEGWMNIMLEQKAQKRLEWVDIVEALMGIGQPALAREIHEDHHQTLGIMEWFIACLSPYIILHIHIHIYHVIYMYMYMYMFKAIRAGAISGFWLRGFQLDSYLQGCVQESDEGGCRGRSSLDQRGLRGCWNCSYQLCVRSVLLGGSGGMPPQKNFGFQAF